MRVLTLVAWLCAAGAASADVIVPARTIRAREILSEQDVLVKSAHVPGALTRLAEVVGQEARIALYPGRPVRRGDVGPPAVIDRNQLITLVFQRGNLRIVADGRALGRGGVGDRIRVMNLGSRTTLTGIIDETGLVVVK